MMPKLRLLTLLALLAAPIIPTAGHGAEAPGPGRAAVQKKYWTEPRTGMKFVWVEGGCYMMGQLPLEKTWLLKEVGVGEYEKYYSDEMPRHKVCVDGFWMGVHEVTQKEWRSIMGFNPATFDEGWLSMVEPGPDIPTTTENMPVDMVSWEDAQSFIEKLDEDRTDEEGLELRLPTEAEWEYAARGGTSESIYYTGDTISWEEANFNGSIPFILNLRQEYRKRPTPVGSFAPNQYGLYDMLGNVWEWCHDWYGKEYYKASPEKNPKGPGGGSMRVLRGGSWFRYAGHIRCATRYQQKPTGQFGDSGFRLVRGIPVRKKAIVPVVPVDVFDPDF